jgi:hypothetical protein
MPTGNARPNLGVLMILMTRRTAILAALGLPAIFPLQAAEKEFWNERKPEDWTDPEREILLTDSPWARKASVDFNSGGGGLGSSRAATRGGGSMSNRRGTPVSPTDPGSPVNPGQYKAIVRWESALPVREANNHKLKDDPAGNYILSVVGDVPMLGGGGGNSETESEFQQREEMLKEFSKLEKKGDPIYLVKIGRMKGSPTQSGTLFYFERNDLIQLNDRTVTFVTKLGPVGVKCKFSLHDMLYQGKLEL